LSSSATANRNTKTRGRLRLECFFSAVIQRVSSGPEAAPRYCCFKKTALSFLKISFATYIAPTLRADIQRAWVDRQSKPISRFARRSAIANHEKEVPMISSEAFVLSLGLLLGSLATWAFKRLPDERWQFLASVPIMKDSSGRWHGLNFTYYDGLLTANALVFGVGLLIVLLGSLHVPTTVTLTLILAVLLVCLPAAKWVARLVEGKSCTFTVAGAFFVGIFVTPVVLHFFNLVLPEMSLRPM